MFSIVREICRDEVFLRKKSEPATIQDTGVGQDLLDTLEANRERCVGMAANMIGVSLRIIVYNDGPENRLMYNPVILKKTEPFLTEEGCLSLTGLRRTRRWKSVKVQWQNEQFQTRIKTFTGWTAQIIQHEIDHCDGILI